MSCRRGRSVRGDSPPRGTLVAIDEDGAGLDFGQEASDIQIIDFKLRLTNRSTRYCFA